MELTIQGLCAFLLGICVLFNNDEVENSQTLVFFFHFQYIIAFLSMEHLNMSFRQLILFFSRPSFNYS